MGASTLRILTPPTSDTSDAPTVLLQCDSTKYMFNAGEGTTRSSAQMRSSNAKVDNIFVSRVSSEAIGGLPGLMMTLADGGRTALAVHGPPTLKYALATTRLYAKRESMRIRVHEIPLADGGEPSRCFTDENVAVFAVPLLPCGESTAPIMADSGPSRLGLEETGVVRGHRSNAAQEADALYTNVLQRAWGPSDDADKSMEYANFVRRLPAPPVSLGTKDGRQAPVLAYICAGHAQRGKFDAAAAAQLGIPPGPHNARLSRGDTVTIQRPVAWASMSATERTQWVKAPGPKGAEKKAQRRGQSIPTAELETVTIRSDQVMGEGRAGPVFIYMYVPGKAYLDSLFATAAERYFAPYKQSSNDSLSEEHAKTPHVIVHAVPREVLEDKRYQEWMQSFGPRCYHVVANRENCADKLMYTSNATNLLRLSRVDQDIFAVPGYKNEAAVPALASLANHGFSWGDSRVVEASANQIVGLHPRAPPTTVPTARTPLDFALYPSEAVRRAAFVDGDKDLLDHYGNEESWVKYCALADEARKAPALAGVPPAAMRADDVSFVTLGTGSSSPSKYRNVLSTILHIPGYGYVLLDAGEGTYAQLARYFGPGTHGWSGKGDGVESVLRDLKLIFVSHIHGDHHMGIARILLERRKLRPRPTRPLYFFSNNYTRNYLEEYDALENLGLSDKSGGVVMIDNEAVDWQTGVAPTSRVEANTPSYAHMKGPASECSEATQRHVAAAQHQLGLTSIRTVPVMHRTGHCYGLVLAHCKGWSIVFSGDTMPCEALAKAGRGATILIHEATMEDEELELAVAKGHSTIGGALQVARDMRASHVLLTHFSQRYPKLARVLSEDSNARGPFVGIAFDMMRITPAGIRRMEKYRPALTQLLGGDGSSASDSEDVPGAPHALASAPPDQPSEERGAKRTKAGEASPVAARRTLRDFAAHYVVLALYVMSAAISADRSARVGSTADEVIGPSDLSVQQGIRLALEEMHGIVGGAFAVDLLYNGQPLSGEDARVVSEAVVRVPSEHLANFTAAISGIASGVAHTALTGHQRRVRVYVRTQTHCLPMIGADSRAWTQRILTQR